MTAASLTLLALLLVQAGQGTKASFQDSVGSELLNRVAVERDTLGDLGDASIDVDAPEQLDLAPAPKVHVASASELALVQSKVSHKESAPKKKAPTQLFDAAFAEIGQTSSKKKGGVDEGIEQSIDLDLAGGAKVKEGSTAKQVLQQASEMEAEANNPDDAADLAIEKEAGDVTKSADAQKEDAEHVVDGAMAYIRTRLATEEHKGLRLRQELGDSVRSNKEMRGQIERLHKQLADSGLDQKNLDSATAKKVAEQEAVAAKEKAIADSATAHMKNATRAAQIGEKAMKFLGVRLKASKTQVASLLLKLAKSSQEGKDLTHQIDVTMKTETQKAKLLVESKRVVAEQAQEIAKARAQLQLLQAGKKADDAKLIMLDRQQDFLKQRESSATKRDKILHKENNLLKSQLTTEVQREEQLREMWSKESEAFTWQLRAERTNASESEADLAKARSEFEDLRKRVQNLRQKAGQGENAKHAAEDQANRAEFALTEAEAENKQLKGSVPWLEAEVDRQRQTAQNVTTQAKQALRERDTVKAILAEAQKSIVMLQGQYADALQALVVAQAGDTNPAANQQQASANSIQQFAALQQPLGADPLGLPPPVESPIGLPQASGASALLELSRDSSALNNIMPRAPQAARAGRVDLNGLLRGMNNAR